MTGQTFAKGVAIVTGAAGGMGRECARLLAEAGWRELILCDLAEERLAAVAEKAIATGARAEILAGEITDPSFMERLRTMIGGRGIGAVVHTAGLSPQMADKGRILAVNLDATIALVDTIRPLMNEGSAALLFASTASYMPVTPELEEAFEQPIPAEGSSALVEQVPDSVAAYLLSKRAVRMLVRREAKSFGDRGARLVSISPGLVDTVMTQGEMDESTQFMLDLAAIPRKGRPEELAAVAAFLVSPNASFMAGCDVVVDGGELAGMGL